MKPEIYLDFGPGYELVTECETNLVFAKKKIEYIQQRVEISGNIVFFGDAYTKIETAISGDTIELKGYAKINNIIQSYFFMDLQGSFDFNKRTIELSAFRPDDIYSEIEKIIDVENILDSSFGSVKAAPLYATINSVFTPITDYYDNLHSICSWLIADAVANSDLSATINFSTLLDPYKIVISPLISLNYFLPAPQDIDVRLKLRDIFNVMKAFNIFWYINELNEITFLHVTEFSSISGINVDLTAKTTSNEVYKYAQPNYPEFEYIDFSNCFFPDFLNSRSRIEYIRNSAESIIHESNIFTTDLGGFWQNITNAQTNGFLFAALEQPYDVLSINEVENLPCIFDTNNVVNGRFSKSKILQVFHTDFKSANIAIVNGTLTDLNTVIKRPLFAREPVKFANVLPSEVDLLSVFETPKFDCVGYELRHDCNSGETQLILEK